jgi:hypothetical protein
LIALIAHLKEEREKIDRESALLEREIKQKKVLIGMEGAEESKEVKEDDAVAVERALIEVRSWLDDALKGWQDVSLALLQVMLIRSLRADLFVSDSPTQTGVLKRPLTTSLPTSTPPQQPPANTTPTSAQQPDEYHHDTFTFPSGDELTTEQVNQYAAYAQSMQPENSGQGHMNLLSEVSMTQGR